MSRKMMWRFAGAMPAKTPDRSSLLEMLTFVTLAVCRLRLSWPSIGRMR